MAINPATRLYIPKFDAPKEAKTQRVESNVSNIVINILPYKIEVFKTIRVDDFIDILCIKTNLLSLFYKGFILDIFQVRYFSLECCHSEVCERFEGLRSMDLCRIGGKNGGQKKRDIVRKMGSLISTIQDGL